MENYIVSARKYRPTTFQSVVGQEALTLTLRNAIRSEHLAHSYLFCGPRGVGKTTCARIFAKTINCSHLTADFEPCNECESCRAFNEQRSFNIHELDAASNNSVEDIRSLIDQVRIPPQIGKYSVYIIDEVHMLSTAAFNALLKTLEEPPSYVIFILATTEKPKIPATILSRCQVYDFARISIDDIVNHLLRIASQEGIQAAPEALNVVAQKADGGLRDALSIFDQLVAYCGDTITYEQTLDILNVLDCEYYFRLVDSAYKGQVNEVLLLFNEILNKGFDASYFLTGLMQHMRDVLVSKDAATVSLLVASDAVRQRYVEQAQLCSAQWLIKALSLINDCDIAYRTTKNKRLTVEIALLKLAQLSVPSASVAQPVVAAPQSSSTTAPVISKPVSSRPAVSRPVEAPTDHLQAKPATAPTMPSLPTLPKIPSLQKNAPDTSQQAPQQVLPKPVTPPTAEPQGGSVNFTEDQLSRAWGGLEAIFEKEARLVATLTEFKPRKQDDFTLVMEVANPWQKKELTKFMPQILGYLREILHAPNLNLQIDVAQYTRTQKAYTSEERFRVLSQANPELIHLKELLKLQVD